MPRVATKLEVNRCLAPNRTLFLIIYLLDTWPPPNIQAVLSKEEIQQRKEEILSTELEIVDAQLKIEVPRKLVTE